MKSIKALDYIIDYIPQIFVIPALISVVSILFTIGLFLKTETTEYLPSISEAGACKKSYPIYSFSMISAASLFFFAVFMWCYFRIYYAKENDYNIGFFDYFAFFFVLLIGFLSFFCMAFQGIVKIDLKQEMDPHRRAAGIFFITGFILCIIMNGIEVGIQDEEFQSTTNNNNRIPKPPLLIMKIRRLLIVLVTVLMVGSGIVNSKVQAIMTMSISPELQQNKAKKYVTTFAIIQYVFVLILMGFLLTFGWSIDSYMKIKKNKKIL